MNPAAEARAKVQAAHPGATVVGRKCNSIKHGIGPNKYALDVGIGPMHYGAGEDQEINTAFVPSITAPWVWEMTKAAFEVRTLSWLNTGQVIEYRDKESGEWVRFQPMALEYSNDLGQLQQISMPQNVPVAVDDDKLTWADGYGPGRTFTWQAQTARLAKRLSIDNLPSVPGWMDPAGQVLQLNLIFAHSNGVTPYINGQAWTGPMQDVDTQEYVEFRLDSTGEALWWFNLPRSWDSDGVEKLGTFRFKKQGNSLYISHRVPLDWIEDAVRVWPIIVDTDIDPQPAQVGADADDGFSNSDGTFTPSAASWMSVGEFGTNRTYEAWHRFTGISGLAGVDIDVAYISLYGGNTDLGTPLTKIFADDSAAPIAPIDRASHVAKVRTTNGTDWDDTNLSTVAYTDSPSIVDVIQELADDYDPSAIQILHDDRGSTNDLCRPEDYTGSSSTTCKLHIEYTGGEPPSATYPGWESNRGGWW